MKFLKEIMTLSLTLSAGIMFLGCGGGGDTLSAGTASTATTTLSGTVADGYLVGAKVCLDKNYNDLCDADEPFVMTDAGGRYTFILPDMGAANFPVLVEADENTTDLDTNTSIGKQWHFKAVSGNSNFISPLSTLVAQEMALNPTLSAAQAMNNLQTELGIDINASVDYIAANHTKAHNAAKIIAHSLANTESNLTALAPSANGRLIRLLAAKQIRSQLAKIQANAVEGNISYLCDVNTTDVTTQIAELNSTIASSLSAQLKGDLLFMWEEERLARDVYLVLYAKWGAKIFANIANNGEQAHMESLKSMIDKYGVDTTGYEAMVPGVFVNANLQALYTSLVAQGSVSVTEGYKVGQLIETTDIADLNQRLQPTDLPADIRAIYENLRQGSENHLAAFNKQL